MSQNSEEWGVMLQSVHKISTCPSIQGCVTQNITLINNSKHFHCVPCENFIHVSAIVQEKITLFLA